MGKIKLDKWMIGDQREINYQVDKYQMIDRETDDKYTVNDTQAEQKNELTSERTGEKRGLQKQAFFITITSYAYVCQRWAHS